LGAEPLESAERKQLVRDFLRIVRNRVLGEETGKREGLEESTSELKKGGREK